MGYKASFSGRFKIKKGKKENFLKFLEEKAGVESSEIGELFSMYFTDAIIHTEKETDAAEEDVYEFSGCTDDYRDEDFEALAPYIEGNWTGGGEDGFTFALYWQDGEVVAVYTIEII